MPVIKGAQVAEAMGEEIIKRAEALKNNGIEPCLAIIRVGEDGSQLSYQKGAVKRMDKNGIACRICAFDEGISQADFEKEFSKINNDSTVHGILILQPLPKSLSIEPIKAMINPLKDVDAISPMNMYKILANDKTGFAPCTAEGVIEILDWMGMDLTGKKCKVIGRSMIVGKPLALLLLARNATVTVCHTRTKELAKEASEADILIAAAGSAKMVKADFVKEGMTVIDVGINVDENGKLCGDVDFENVEPIVENITPVPGGTGAVTTSVLAKHVVKAAEMLNN
ncbi:MAG: bifunctional 5,10-methylenetetrahydrofolate dehydrogenase/5,10-methenyltetrahydrofolate cyclohydrolase [Clostridiales bacterium]|nr:bifunctional 5,10-methylenetetrahydrofolate dehydrogenase/5,10-methenyltetrahydrofolate cyclohydrolase [Clostridiales bacterium]